MKLKIQSNGTIQGTKITHAETGEPLGGVQSVDIHVGVSSMPEAHIVTTNQEFVFEGSAYWITDVLRDFTHWLQSGRPSTFAETGEHTPTEAEKDVLYQLSKHFHAYEAFRKSRREG